MNLHAIASRFVKSDLAQMPPFEILEMPRLDYLKRDIGDHHVALNNPHEHLAAALSASATLQDRDVEFPRRLEFDRPLAMVIGVDPVADGVFERLRFIAERVSKGDRHRGGQ